MHLLISRSTDKDFFENLCKNNQKNESIKNQKLISKSFFQYLELNFQGFELLLWQNPQHLSR